MSLETSFLTCSMISVMILIVVQNKHQPWDTLMKYRRIDEGMKYKPCFGMLCVPRNEGRIELGMRFEVLAETQDHKFMMPF